MKTKFSLHANLRKKIQNSLIRAKLYLIFLLSVWYCHIFLSLFRKLLNFVSYLCILENEPKTKSRQCREKENIQLLYIRFLLITFN